MNKEHKKEKKNVKTRPVKQNIRLMALNFCDSPVPLLSDLTLIYILPFFNFLPLVT